MFYVYSGSYKDEENALNAGFSLFKSGYDVICTKLNRYFRLQVGAFESYENAEAFVKNLNENGFPAFIDDDKQPKRIDESWQLIYLMQS